MMVEFSPSSSQSEDGENNTDGTDTHGKDGRSDLDTSSRTGGATSSSIGRAGSSRGPSAGGTGRRRCAATGVGTDRGRCEATGVGTDRGRCEAAGGGESGIDGGRGVGNTVGRSGDLGLVRHGGDFAQRLRGLRVGLNVAAGVGVDAGVVLVVAVASLENTVLGVIRGIVSASDAVVDVFAEARGIRASRVASLEAEELTAEETRAKG